MRAAAPADSAGTFSGSSISPACRATMQGGSNRSHSRREIAAIDRSSASALAASIPLARRITCLASVLVAW